jgi:O-antigen ligase
MTDQRNTPEATVRPVEVRADVLGGARAVWAWAFVAGASVLAGAAASSLTDQWGGQRNTLFLVGALLALPLVGIFASLGSLPLVAWAPLSVVAYDLVRIPRSGGSTPIITFDHLWIPALIVYLALEHRRFDRSGASRFLSFSLAWLVIAFGLRSELSNFGLTGSNATWIDAIVLPTILLAATARYAVTPERTQRIAASLMIAGGILGGIGVAQRIWSFELATLAGGAARFDEAIQETRVSGPYAVPETYALSVVVCLAATLYWMQTRKRTGTYFWGVLIAGLEIGGLAFSLFRAAWIAGLVVIVASFGIRPRRFARTLMVVGLAAAIAVAVTAQLEQNKSFSTRTKNTSNIYGRLATYEQGIEIFRSAPLFGVGVNRYHDVALSWKPVEVRNVPAIDFPHSSYVGLLAEQGLFGFVPLVVVSFAVWRVLRRLRAVAFTNEAAVLTGSVTGAAIGFLIMSLTLTMLPYSPSNLFFAVLLGVAVGRLDALSSERSR